MDPREQIKSKIDIVPFIQEHIPLKQTGRNFKTTCPFHGEKTPSFVVSPERQIWHCFGCFPPGEIIKTPFGYHPIESIVEDELVISGKGQYRRVLTTHTREYVGDLITLKTRKLKRAVSLTGDHHVFAIRPTARHEKRFKYFAKRYRAYTKYLKTSPQYYFRKTEKWLPIQEIEARKLQVGDLLLYPLNDRVSPVLTIDLNTYVTKKSRLGPQPSLLPKIEVNEDFLRLIGYYIAEGSNHRAYIRFSLGNHEKAFAKEIVNLIKKIFSLDASIHYRKSESRTGIEITACHAYLANVFENLCGHGAENKHIPFIFQELSPELQRVLLEAIHRGDGTTFLASKSSKLHKSITTVSKILSEQLIDILLRLSTFPSLYIGGKKIDKNSVNHREAYTIIWSQEARLKYDLIYHTRDGQRYWLLPITDRESQLYKGPVYNLTVDTDHSYMASHFAVSNCGKGGDVFTFLMEFEKMDFVEALRTLAKRTGVKLARFAPSKTDQVRDRLLQINHLASEFYHYLLTSHAAGEKARDYLEGRGIRRQIIDTFLLGFAPNKWELLFEYLTKKKGFSPQEVEQAGLIVQSAKFKVQSSRYYDRFRNRIMFTLKDHRGNVVGFAGRLLDPNAKEAKYVNTPETSLYHKGELLYGLDIAKEAIKKEDHAIVVEGEFDMIQSFQSGITNVVALKGTALTQSQVKLLRRFTTQVSLAFDEDVAGDAAARRGFEIAENGGLNIKIIRVQDGKDPDEAIRKNPLSWKKAIKSAASVYDFLIDSAIARFDKTTPEGKRYITDEVLPSIAAISNEIVKAHFVKRIAGELDTTEDVVMRQMEKLVKPDLPAAPIPVKPKPTTRQQILEEYLMALLLQKGDRMLIEKVHPQLEANLLQSPVLEKILHLLLAFYEKESTFAITPFVTDVPKELLPTVDRLYLIDTEGVSSDQIALETERTLGQLRAFLLRRNMERISKEMQQLEKENERDKSDDIARLQRQFTMLSAKLSKLA